MQLSFLSLHLISFHLISSLFSQLAALFELEEAAVEKEEEEEKKLFYKFRIIDETNNERRELEKEKLRGNGINILNLLLVLLLLLKNMIIIKSNLCNLRTISSLIDRYIE